METKREAIYPVTPWDIIETEFKVEHNYRNETTFALSNGYIGTRGTLEENYDFDIETGLEGNFINGFYEQEPIRYGEWNFGFPTESQSLLNLPNVKTVRFYIEDELFDMRQGTISDYQRVLHMKEGIVERSLIWTSPNGRRVQIRTERMVSFVKKNWMEQLYEVTLLDKDSQITFVSELDADIENHTRKTNPLVDYGPFGRRLYPDKIEADKELLFYQGTTKNSNLTMACGCFHKVLAEDYTVCASKSEFKAELTYKLEAKKQVPVQLEKYIAYTSTLDEPKEELEEFIKKELEESKNIGYEKIRQMQVTYMHNFWEGADIQIDGDNALQQGLRFNLFHIMQGAGRDGKTGMGAKGLTGEGYEGHYFWDTEMYVLPVLVFTDPALAKSLLHFRFETLDQARERARILGHQKGALYPWRTINGTEASTYYPLGTAQYHINADIAYAFWLYYSVTKDYEFLKEEAVEVLCETARVWADVGSFAECKGNRYCICCVTGPDEYNALVDNNFYTNLMARENLRAALKALEIIKEEKEAYDRFVHKIGLTDDECVLWQKIIEKMYLPYDEQLGIYPQDDGFLMRKQWDDSKIPEEKRHLLYENYHPLFVFRQKMSKQADAILGFYLHSNFFTKEEIKKNYDFYQTVTLHHSSLSTCIFGIVACQIGYYEEAFRYFTESARMDLDDYHNNFYAGIHAANMAGTWQAMVNGFAGMRVNNGKLEFHPFLPESWNGYRFLLTYQKSRLEVNVLKGEVIVTLKNKVPVSFWLGEKEYKLEKEGDVANEKI